MVYTVPEKQRMDELLTVFSDYIARNPHMDIAYSDKTGFVKLIIAEYADAVFFPISDFDELLESLIHDIVTDAEEESINACPKDEEWIMDYEPVRRMLTAYLEKLTADREYALRKLDACLTPRENRDYCAENQTPGS